MRTTATVSIIAQLLYRREFSVRHFGFQRRNESLVPGTWANSTQADSPTAIRPPQPCAEINLVFVEHDGIPFW
jgi:hypothetical protein